MNLFLMILNVFIFICAENHNTNVDVNAYAEQLHKNIASKQHSKEEQIKQLRENINLLLSHNKKKKAAELYVQLWHITQQFSDLNHAADLYIMNKEYSALCLLLDNLIILKGIDFNNYELLLLLAHTIYLKGMNSEDVTLLNKAKEFFAIYEERVSVSAFHQKYIDKVRLDIDQVFAILDMRALLHFAKNEKQSAIVIMRNCLNFIAKYPDSKYIHEANKLYLEMYQCLQLHTLNTLAPWNKA